MWFIYFCELGGYDNEDKAARAYDLAALKYWGPATHINFPVSVHIELSYKKTRVLMFIHVISYKHFLWQVENYQAELEEMKNMTRQEFVAHLRRFVSLLCMHYKSNCFPAFLTLFLITGEAVGFLEVPPSTEGWQGLFGQNLPAHFAFLAQTAKAHM